jgi:magnesium transporter
MPKATPLLPLVQDFVEQDPAAAARRLEAMPEDQAATVVHLLPSRLKSRVFPHLQVTYAAALLKGVSPQDFEVVLRGLEPERAAAIFAHLPDDAQDRLIGHLPEKVRRHSRELLEYPQDSVGRVMTLQFLSLHKSLKARDAVRKIRSLSKGTMSASYAYVVDADDALVGVMNMHDLLLADPDAPLESVMHRDVFTLRPFSTVTEAADELSKRRYFVAPVVDAENRMLGIVKAERLIQNAPNEIGRDIQKMFGAGGDEGAFSTLGYSLRKRLPWLHVNLGTAFLAAGVVALFEPTIAKITVLAVFLPVVAGQGGNAGAQSLAVVMRGLVMREIPRKRYRQLILKEGWLGLISGAATGAVTAAVAWLWQGNPMLGLVIGLGMIVNLLCAGFAGASIPIGLKSLGLDPAQCSNIILTTVTDVVGFLAFLGFAVLFRNSLV